MLIFESQLNDFYGAIHEVQLLWEDHKNVHSRPYGFEIYLVNVKTMRTIAQIFVAFSKKAEL